MDDLVVFGLIVLSIIRVFGFLISLDFYVNLRNNRYIFLILGWFCWFLAGLFPLIADFTIESFLTEFFIVLNGMFVTLGAFLIVLGITNVFRSYQPRLVISIIAFLVILPVIVNLSGGNKLVSIISSIIVFFSYFIIMILDSLVGEDFKEKVGNSHKWFIFLRVVVVLQILIMIYAIFKGGSFGLYDSSDALLIILNYGVGIALSLVIVILMIHFEHSVTTFQKDYLKDTFTHDLGNILQIISSATEMLEVPDDSREKSELILKKSNEASKLINKIKNL